MRINTLQVRKWALIVCALYGIFISIRLGLYGPQNISKPVAFVELIYVVLFVVGISVIQVVQPQTKIWGIIGLLLMIFSRLSQLSNYLLILFSDHPAIRSILVFMTIIDPYRYLFSIPLLYFGISYIGHLIVGFATIKARVFPMWAGWALALSGMLYFVSSTQSFYSPSEDMSFLFTLGIATALLSIALMGFGWHIPKQQIV